MQKEYIVSTNLFEKRVLASSGLHAVEKILGGGRELRELSPTRIFSKRSGLIYDSLPLGGIPEEAKKANPKKLEIESLLSHSTKEAAAKVYRQLTKELNHA